MGEGDRDRLIHEQHRATRAGHTPDPVETRDSHTQPIPRRSGRAWLYAVPILALVVIGAVWMLRTEVSEDSTRAPFGTTGTSGERSRGHDPEGARADGPLNPAPEGPRVISDMALLSSKEQYAGRSVQFDAIPVYAQEGPRTFWVGRLTDRALVLVDQGAGQAQVKRGEMIALQGQLERTPDENALARAGLAKEDRAALKGEDVIIRATRIEAAPSAGANQGAIPGRQKKP